MALLEKLLQVKQELPKLIKDSENPFFKSEYLSLNALLEYVEPVLWMHGLYLEQPIEYEGDGRYSQVSRIHILEGDEVVESRFPLAGDKAQDFGCSSTYGRRYSLLSLLALRAEDDDGNLQTMGASKPPTNGKKPTAQKAAPSRNGFKGRGARKNEFVEDY